MIVLRWLMLLGLIAILVSIVWGGIMQDKRYFRFAWQLLKFIVTLLLAGLLLMSMERILVL